MKRCTSKEASHFYQFGPFRVDPDRQLLLRSGEPVPLTSKAFETVRFVFDGKDMDKFALTTKRLVLGHVSVCQGCCCGNTANGKPAVPVEWLKEEWRARGLLKRIQLSISGCLGPCDIPNVVTISTRAARNGWGELLNLINTALCALGPFLQKMRASCCLFLRSFVITPCIHFVTPIPAAACLCSRQTIQAPQDRY